MQPGGDLRQRRRTRTWLVVVAVVLAVLLVLGVVGFLGVRYVAGLVGAAGGGGFDDGSGEAVGEVDVPVERMDLTSTVAATGSLTAGRPVTLGFTGSGEITSVEVAVGDRVVPGQVLARLDPRLAQLDLDAAEAALAAAERAAGAGTSGGSADAVAAQAAEARVAVSSARTALARTQDLADAAASGYSSAVDAAARQRDRDAAAAGAAQAALASAQAAQTPPAARQAAEAELAAARAAAASTREALVTVAREVAAGTKDDADLAAAQIAVDAAAARVADAQEVLGAADATVEAVAAARAEAQAARATADAGAEAVVAAEDARRTGLASDAQTVDAARSAVQQAEAALQVLLSGGTPEGDGGPAPEELQVAVDRARLDVETARAALSGTTVVAPVAATVTAVDATVGTAVGEGAVVPAGGGTGGTGETAVSPGTITLTATQALVAEVEVPETDAVLLEEGMPAELKFSALPDVVGTGQVLTVVASQGAEGGAEQGFDPFTGQPTPAQKTYTVTVAVDELPQGARGGLTIAARITTGSSPGALVVPTAAVLQADGRTMVRTVDGEAVEEVEVDLGLRQGGFSEVVDGLEEGDLVRVGDAAMGVGPDGAPLGP